MNDLQKKKQFDLEKIIGEKNPTLLKLLPTSVLRYIKRIIHQEEFNRFLQESENEKEYDFINAAIKNFQIQVSSHGSENIPGDKGCIIACNHPLGGIDGIAVMSEVGKIRKDIKALVNDILMNLENMNSLLIPVNKHGKNIAEGIRRIDQAYASDQCVIVFPAGLVSRKQKGKIKDLEWKKSFITKAVRYQHDIIPTYVHAQNSRFFYNLAFFRKKLGIKANIEMFYLVDEVYKQKGKSIEITFGQPISWKTFTKNNSDQCWAEKVKEHVYSLKQNKAAIF